EPRVAGAGYPPRHDQTYGAQAGLISPYHPSPRILKQSLRAAAASAIMRADWNAPRTDRETAREPSGPRSAPCPARCAPMRRVAPCGVGPAPKTSRQTPGRDQKNEMEASSMSNSTG